VLFSQEATLKQDVTVNRDGERENDLLCSFDCLVVLPKEASNNGVLDLNEYTFTVYAEWKTKSYAISNGVDKVEYLRVDGNCGDSVNAAVFSYLQNLRNLEDAGASDDCETQTLTDGEFMAL